MGIPIEKSRDLSLLLRQSRSGDHMAFEDLVGVIYENLRRMVRKRVPSPGQAYTLSPSALVREIVLKMSTDELDRREASTVAAKSMRWLLKDLARAKRREATGVASICFESLSIAPENLDGALCTLEKTDPKLARIVELRYLVGMTEEEAACALSISIPNFDKDWQFACSWMVDHFRT